MLAWFTLSDDSPAGEANRVLAELVQRLHDADLALAGAVQRNTDQGSDCACDMDLLVIGDEDQPIRISQSLGAGSTGCRLDSGALEVAAGRVAARMEGAQLVILPKFGKQEAIGRGFRNVIAMAIENDQPVLLHVPRQQRQAFDAFCGGMAQELQADQLEGWCHAQVVEQVT
ncbi:DUF2478 domain-containing protein [Paracoccus sp. 11-3]|uniref:DUF2478 domain-containing protein n=1 Tax=Paracoccus amoyensis TaxID=2760093 RepID=A0A926GA21_9RHOB|nr:DUF2478 domain-containing protein [Paracoccus amoyensis]MBC9246111.1 DUF2478 domain-containing protein [Paracoccus amoyensis]